MYFYLTFIRAKVSVYLSPSHLRPLSEIFFNQSVVVSPVEVQVSLSVPFEADLAALNFPHLSQETFISID